MARPSEIYRAIRTVLKINYKTRLLDVIINPKMVILHYAVSFLRDDQENWLPRLIIVYKREDKVGIFTHYGDNDPTIVSTEALLTMAKNKMTDPNSPGSAG